MIALFFPLSGFTAVSTYLLTKELWSAGAGLFSACFIAIVPGYISRSVAGSYDNEGIAIFALQFTYYLWVCVCFLYFCFVYGDFPFHPVKENLEVLMLVLELTWSPLSLITRKWHQLLFIWKRWDRPLSKTFYYYIHLLLSKIEIFFTKAALEGKKKIVFFFFLSPFNKIAFWVMNHH